MDFEYDNAKFNGHQVGVAICIQDKQTGKIECNMLPSTLGDERTRDLLLSELLYDKSILLIENSITQLDEKKINLIPKTVYYLPYYVVDHSAFKPTVNFDNVSMACNVSYDLKVEVLFVEDGYNRYLTIPLKTRNVSIMELVYSLFDDDCSEKEELEEIGIKWHEDIEDGCDGYVLDFYNEAGERNNLFFDSLEQLRDAIVSMRLIDIVCYIDGKEEYEEES